MKKIFNAILYMLLPLTVMAADPAEGHEAEIPAWVNAGADRFEGTAAMKPYLSREKKPDVHSDELTQAAFTIIDDLSGKVAGDTRELIHKTHEKVNFLTENAKFDYFAYSSMHMYLASLISPKETDIGIFVDRLQDFNTAWEKLVPGDKGSLDRYDELMNRAIGYNAAEYGLSPKVLRSLALLPMYASSQEEGNLGVKPLLENTLKGYIPFILTPPGKGSVHGGIVQSPLEMISHDFVHALIIQSYLDRRRFFPRFTSVSDSLKSYDFLSIGRSFFDGFFGFNYIKEEALSNLSKLDLATEEGQRKLMKLFVAFHEFPTNDIFKTYDDFIEGKKAKIMRGSDFRDFFQKNIDHIARLYDQDEGALKQAYETLVGSKLEIYIKNQSLDDMMDFLKNHPLGFEITPEGLEALSTNNESACLLKCFDSDHVIVTRDDRPASQSKSRIKLVIYSKAMRADEVITNVTTISDSFFKKEFILKNFEDYGKILQMVGLIDPKLNPELLEGRQIVEGLRCLMDS